MTANSFLVCAAIIAVAYVVVANRLLALGSHFRVRAIDLGTQLLENPAVPDDVKDGVEGWLCDIPRAKFAWVLNLLLVPAVFLVVIRRWRGKAVGNEGMPSPTAPYWKTWDDFTTMAVIATLCNSPLALSLGIIQMLFAVSFVHGNYAVWVVVNRMAHRDGGPFGLSHNHAHS